MVVDLPISESSAYEAGPTIDKSYKEKETNKDKRSVKLENVGDISDYENTSKRKIDQEENNNRSKNVYSFSSSLAVLENTDGINHEDKSIISKVKSEKVLRIQENSICISSSTHQNTLPSQQKEKDLNKDSKLESLEIVIKPNDERNENINESKEDESKTSIRKDVIKVNSCTTPNNKDIERAVPGKNCNAPLFIPSQYNSNKLAPEIIGYAMKEPCIYYPTYPSYYNSPHPISYNHRKNYSNHVEASNKEPMKNPSKKLQMNRKEKSIENDAIVLRQSTESIEDYIDFSNEKENKSLSAAEPLTVIKRNESISECHQTTKDDSNKANKAEMGDVSEVECLSPSSSQFNDLQDDDCSGNIDLHDSYSMAVNSDEPTFLPSPHPMLSPITGNHGDLFINPALAAQAHGHLQAHGLVHPDPPAFVSFLSDGTMVGPMGEMYCPPPDYYLLDQNGDLPPGLVSPPQGSNFEGELRMTGLKSQSQYEL